MVPNELLLRRTYKRPPFHGCLCCHKWKSSCRLRSCCPSTTVKQKFDRSSSEKIGRSCPFIIIDIFACLMNISTISRAVVRGLTWNLKCIGESKPVSYAAWTYAQKSKFWMFLEPERNNRNTYKIWSSNSNSLQNLLAICLVWLLRTRAWNPSKICIAIVSIQGQDLR